MGGGLDLPSHISAFGEGLEEEEQVRAPVRACVGAQGWGNMESGWAVGWRGGGGSKGETLLAWGAWCKFGAQL